MRRNNVISVTPFLEALQTDIIRLIHREGPMTLPLMRRRLGIVSIGDSRLRTALKRAEKNGLITIHPQSIGLTAEGRSWVKEALGG